MKPHHQHEGGSTAFWRILEALAIAALTSVATGYIGVKVLEDRVSVLATRMDKVEAVSEQRYDKIQGDLQRLYYLVAELRPQERTRR